MRAILLSMVVAAGLCRAEPVHAESAFVTVPGLKLGVTGLDRFNKPQARIEAFRQRLGEHLHTTVTVVPLRDGLALIDALATAKVDYAVLSASAYAQTERTCGCVEPLVVPRSLDGSTQWRAELVVRGDSSAQSLADLKGTSAVAAPDRSFAGRVYPLAALAANGFMGTDGFSRIDTVAGPEEALRALIDRKADVALSWSPVEATAGDGMDPRGPLARLIARKVAGADTLRVLWSSDPVPNGPHVVRSSLPQDMRVKLRDFLINLKSDDAEAYEAIEPDFGGGFVPVSKDAFSELVKVLGGR